MAQQENRDHTLARHPEGLFGYLMPRSGPVIEPGVCPDLPGEVLILGIRVVEEFKREAFTVEISLREPVSGDAVRRAVPLPSTHPMRDYHGIAVKAAVDHPDQGGGEVRVKRVGHRLQCLDVKPSVPAALSSTRR
jgi:hypothetical protein